MVDEEPLEGLTEDEADEENGLVPYAPDFTPATLGKTLGEDAVLPWLLHEVLEAASKAALQTKIADVCLKSVPNKNDRRDMASHVVQALQNYELAVADDEGAIILTSAGESVLNASDAERDEVFARHILARCNGLRLIEACQRFELRGERPSMEELTEELDRSATAKNLSTMKAWLQRAGVMRSGKAYVVDDKRLVEVLGADTKKLLGLDPGEVEFMLAARVLTAQQTDPVLEGADVRLCAQLRAPGTRIPAKMLGAFVRRLVERGLLAEAPKAKGKGGSRVAFTLTASGIKLTDDQVRAFVAQSGSGMLLSDLKKLDELTADLAGAHAEEAGRLGEMLAVHVCLMLGIRVIGWRTRAPAEVDLTAERTAGLAYQRWHVQVKNTATNLDIDHVDREVGAAAGTGATHLLFVVPRAYVTTPARAEALSKAKLTHLHVYLLTKDAFAPPFRAGNLGKLLLSQEAHLARVKRNEAERRERTA